MTSHKYFTELSKVYIRIGDNICRLPERARGRSYVKLQVRLREQRNSTQTQNCIQDIIP